MIAIFQARAALKYWNLSLKQFPRGREIISSNLFQLMAHILHFVPVLLPWQRRPAEHVPGDGWYQSGERLRRVKLHYAFVWPKDGKRGRKMGRWKDIFANEGPDIHVAISADKRDALYNRQRRVRRSRWTELDDREPDGALTYRPLWVRFFRGQEKMTSELESMEGLNGIHGQMRGGKRSRTRTSFIHKL